MCSYSGNVAENWVGSNLHVSTVHTSVDDLEHYITEGFFKQADCSRLGLLGPKTQDRDLHGVNFVR